MGDVVIQQRDGALLTLRLNRPERRNALNAELLDALVAALTKAADDPQIGCVLIQGEGGTFCVGGDVKSMASENEARRAQSVEERTSDLRRRMEASRLLHDMAKPTVAAIAGAAAGAGLSLALACDFRIAGRSAKLTTAFAKVALAGDFGGTYFMTRLLGSARARDLYLRSPVLTAEQALAIGLVTSVVDDADLDRAAKEFALGLANGPRITLGYMKQNLNLAEHATLSASLDAEAALHTRSAQTEDHREAAAAFVEKRQPVFKGR